MGGRETWKRKNNRGGQSNQSTIYAYMEILRWNSSVQLICTKKNGNPDILTPVTEVHHEAILSLGDSAESQTLTLKRNQGSLFPVLL
jgi:hypothetical protein